MQCAGSHHKPSSLVSVASNPDHCTKSTRWCALFLRCKQHKHSLAIYAPMSWSSMHVIRLQQKRCIDSICAKVKKKLAHSLGHLRSHIHSLQRRSGDYPEFSACLETAIEKETNAECCITLTLGRRPDYLAGAQRNSISLLSWTNKRRDWNIICYIMYLVFSSKLWWKNYWFIRMQ